MARYPLWRGSHPRLRPQSWRRCYALQDVAFPQGYTPAPHELAAWTEAQRATLIVQVHPRED
jgi:hypothetical protein